MKKSINIIIVFLALTVIVYASGSYISSFTANSDGKVVRVQWSTMNEEGLESFEIQRKATDGSFTLIGDEDAKGNPSSYEFVDDNELMKESGKESPKVQNESKYSYRLKIIKEDQSFEYSNTVNVFHKTNSIRKTWGMIKEMFR